jgi:hypothetical protein
MRNTTAEFSPPGQRVPAAWSAETTPLPVKLRTGALLPIVFSYMQHCHGCAATRSIPQDFCLAPAGGCKETSDSRKQHCKD